MNLAVLTGLLLTANSVLAADRRALTIDDFEDKDRRAASGLSWISIADDLMGGTSSAELQVIDTGPLTRHALRVTGEVATSGFAGAWVALDGRARAADVSDFQGIRLRVRGNGVVQLGLRAGPSPGFNYMAAIEPGPDWKSVEVPFDGLRPTNKAAPAFDRASARWLGISVGAGRVGRFDFEIDGVELYTDRSEAQLRVQSGPTWTVAFEASPASDAPKGPWRELARDAPDDGKQKRLPDATDLAVCFKDAQEHVWFRIALAGPIPPRWLGVNLAFDIDGDPTNGMAWWGTNQAFRFDRLVTVYGSATERGYEGMLGIADAAEVQAGNLEGSSGERVRIALDHAKPALVVGIPRGALGNAPTASVRVVAAVGSAMQHNDDVPNSGAAHLLDALLGVGREENGRGENGQPSEGSTRWRIGRDAEAVLSLRCRRD